MAEGPMDIVGLPGPVVQPPADPAAMVSEQIAAISNAKLQVSVANGLRTVISEIERFDGEPGELNHFLKAAEAVHEIITAKKQLHWITEADAPALRAQIVSRISRRVLNMIQCDQDTLWEVVKIRLKKSYGGAQWAPEEDVWRLIRESRRPHQSAGDFAARMLEWRERVIDKMCEQLTVEESRLQVAFVDKLLKVHLRRETGKDVPESKNFCECARAIVDEGNKELEDRWVRREEQWEVPRSNRAPRRRREWRGPSDRGGERRRRSREKVRETRQGNGIREPRRAEPKTCYECGSDRHLAARCDRVRCYLCSRSGHRARDCTAPRPKTTPYLGEPMEVNAQGVRRSFADVVKDPPSSVRGTSESEDSERSSWTRVSASRRKQHKQRSPLPQ